MIGPESAEGTAIVTDVVVLGAGMVGVATALALQGRGRAVVLVDRREPGRETSYGNSGVIQAEAMEPYPMPRDLASLLSIALRRGNEVHWHLAALPSYLGPLWRYFLHSGGARYRAVSAVYSRLTARATAAHAPLIEAAGSQALIRREGFRQLYRSAGAMERAAREAERLRAAYGVGVELETGAELAAAEPNLLRPMAGAVRWTDPWTCSDPGGLVAAYAALFSSRSGTLLKGDAETLEQTNTGWRVRTEDGPVEAAEAVVALGPWSPPLLKRFGYHVPMLRKRGYHRHFDGAKGPRLPFLDGENAAVCSPMRAGLRVTTAAELAAFDTPATPRQLVSAARAMRELIDLGDPVEAEPWLGNRPCMPDMLPVLGPAARHKGLWLHFGHGHQGFTLGPATAALLADWMTEGRADDLAAGLTLERGR